MKKLKIKLLFTLAFTSLGFSACSQNRVESRSFNLLLKTMLSHSVQEISVGALDSLVQKKGTVPILLDARERKEFEVSRINNAQWIGYDDFEVDRVKHLPKDKTIVVYCSIGARSENIAQRLEEEGFTDVMNLYGGIFEWVNQNKPVVNANGATKKVHAYSKSWGIWLKNGEKVYE